MATDKRTASNAFGSSQMVVKRQKSDTNLRNSNAVVAAGSGGNGALVQSGAPRLSSLPAPVLSLTGHAGEVFAVRFDPSGQHIASGSFDRKILLWNTYGDNANYGVLSGHKAAVLDLGWSRDGQVLFSGSADTTVASWDLETGMRIRRHEGHEEVVNAIDVSRRGEQVIVSGSDDGAVGIWDPRQKYAAAWIESDMPVTSVALPEAGNEIYTGGVDNEIKVWDIRKRTVSYTMRGHGDTVTSLSVSPDSQYLLSYGHDGAVKSWDIRPFAAADRCVRTFDGAQVGLDRNLLRASWDSKGERVVAGSGDGSVVVWEARTGRLLARLPGHKGSVNDVRFEPTGEPVLVSASTDRSLMLGEIGR